METIVANSRPPLCTKNSPRQGDQLNQKGPAAEREQQGRE